jgi:pyridine nucleotide-disulfide oxidoreductase family protein
VKRLLLLGGGHAHVHVLQALARQALPSAEVLLVSPYPRQMYSGMVPGLVAGHYKADQCAISLPPLAHAAGARWLETAATRIDAAARQVHTADGQVLAYDALSLDTGAVMARDRIPGAREHGVFVRPIEDFVALQERLLDLAARRVLDVVVLGGGAAGVELAMALAHRLGAGAAARKKRGAPADERARVALVTGGAEPLAGYSEAVKRLVLQALARQRVTVFRDSCARIEAKAVVLGSGARLACDVPVMATGADAPAWLLGSGLALSDNGFVQVSATLQSRSHADVFAVGDVSARTDRAHARSGVYAVRAGPPLAANLRLFMAGGALLSHQPPARTLNLISCGEHRAIASWGNFCAQGRWAWWWKDRIDRGFIARYAVGPHSTQATAVPGQTPTKSLLAGSEHKG